MESCQPPKYNTGVDSRLKQIAIKYMNLKNEYKEAVIFATCSFISHHAQLNSAINRN